MNLGKYESAILSKLNLHRWKSSLEIMSELEEVWERDSESKILFRVLSSFSEDLAQIIYTPSIGGVYTSLSRLERRRLIEGRTRAVQSGKPEAAVGHGSREWRLSEIGLKSRRESVHIPKVTSQAGMPAHA